MFFLHQERDLTVCDTLKACYLVNIQTRQETELTGNDSFELDPLNTHGYSIRCNVNGEATLDFMKFMYDGVVQDEYGEPRYMNGDSEMGEYINDVKYLSTCGVKTLKIEGNVWSNPCFEKHLLLMSSMLVVDHAPAVIQNHLSHAWIFYPL